MFKGKNSFYRGKGENASPRINGFPDYLKADVESQTFSTANLIAKLWNKEYFTNNLYMSSKYSHNILLLSLVNSYSFLF